MKRFLIVGVLFISICFFGQKAIAQSTTITPGGILPNMTTEQRTELINPPNGMLVFDSNTQSYWFRQSGAWVELPKGGSTSNYWELNGANGNELKNTNSGGFWSANPTEVEQSATDITNPPTAPINGGGTRIMWIPSRSAFRAGTVDYNNWDADSIGIFSTAFGYDSKASSKYSTSIGNQTIASGDYSVALGSFSKAKGEFSLASGYSTEAFGNYSSALGNKTKASGAYSVAMSVETNASGTASTALGIITSASGLASTAMGYRTFAKATSSTTIGSFNNILDSPNPTSSSLSDRIFQIGNGSSEENRSNALTVLKNGKIGINNINSPSAMLHIKGDNLSNIKLELPGSSTDYAEILAYPNTLQLNSPGTGRFLFVSASGITATLNSLGYLALARIGNDGLAPLHIGEHGPDTWERHIRLDYDASSDQYGNIVYDYEGMKFRTWGDGDDFYFRNKDNTSVARINDTGNMTIAGTLTQNSDRRLKTNFSQIQNSSSKLASLDGYHYNWKAADREQSLQTGLIAQEVQKEFPELVNVDEEGYLSVNYIGLIPHLIEAQKELKTENEMLKERLLKIEEKLNLTTQTASIK